MQASGIPSLARFLDRHPRLMVLTGAGISVASGIPEYRDRNGDWMRPAPVQYRDFLDRAATRRRYWARSLAGWPWFRQARPNRSHTALAGWEAAGRVQMLVTQNVDRLHQAAGASAVIDLHGRLDQVVCLGCSALFPRDAIQREIEARNPGFETAQVEIGPDGDARLERDFGTFTVPDCPACGGILKPDVVFFGETIPRPRVDAALEALRAADALLVIGSSLMVYSGYRFCLRAREWNKPLAVVNPGRTRADDMLELKVTARFEDVIDRLPIGALNPQRQPI